MKRLGDLYEWMGEKRKSARRLHVFFLLVFAVELSLLSQFVTYFAFRQMWETFASVIGPLGGLLMTTALVYSNLKQSPALRLVGFSIEPGTPETMDRWDSLDDKYKGTLNVQSSTGYPTWVQLHEVRPQKLKRFPYTVSEVRFKKTLSKLRATNDLTNIGSVETNIHEYAVEGRPEEASPCLTRYTCRQKVELQTRITLCHIFPTNGDLHKGFYQLKITAVAATQQLSQSCWVWVSENGKTIRWCSKKRPLKICEKLKTKER